MTTSTRSTITDIYARAVLGQAIESDDAKLAIELSRSFEELAWTIINTPGLRVHLIDSGLPLEVRLGLVDRLFPELAPVFSTVIKLLIERKELKLLSTISNRFTGLIEEHFGVEVIDVTTVVVLDDTLRQAIEEKYSAQLSCPVVLREHVDPDILGGIILEMRDRRIDASLTAQLVRARLALTSETIGGAD
ncbi:MAG: F0F1 ATP synthase subunit delta [Coriobacteriales bacterium]|jgi:F-type H+-transporting ATPase subunit delta|nr:F0F1 ATP synthase subunit delta [Coriobacteriales bacterium]